MDDIHKILGDLKDKASSLGNEISRLKIHEEVYSEVITIIEKQIESDASWEKRKKVILEHLESGTYKLDGTHRRKPGTRPESLQNIRRAYRESKRENS